MTVTFGILRRVGVSAWNTGGAVLRSRPGRSSPSRNSRSTTTILSSSSASSWIQRTRETILEERTQNRFSTRSTHTTTTRLFSSSTSSPSSSSSSSDEEDGSLFDTTHTTFESMGIQSPVLLKRMARLGLTHPTKVQVESFATIGRRRRSPNDDDDNNNNINNNINNNNKPTNVIVGSETGSGKTLAYLLPLLEDILTQKQEAYDDDDHHNMDAPRSLSLTYDYARAMILVPNKELVQQVLRMAIPLCGGGSKSVIWNGGIPLPDDNDDDDDDDKTCPAHERVRLAVLPGGLVEPLDFKPFRDSIALGGGTEPPIDILISTPAALGPLGLKPKHIDMFADIQTLVVDEADMLLDGGYIRPLENVLMGFRRADRLDPSMGVPPTQHIFCAATLPDMGLKSVDAYLQRKFPRAQRIHMSGMHNARHYGLKQATQWIGPVETKKERMEQLMEMLKTSSDQGGLLGEKVMVFLNSVEDVEGAQHALERAGIASVPYHAKIELEERSKNLDRFRRYKSSSSSSNNSLGPRSSTSGKDTVPVLVCTDLASRGLDVPEVSAVVQLQFSGNVVSHLHRMGRCGRAGQRTGRGIVFFTGPEEELVNVVRDAEEQQERMVLEGDVDDNPLDDEEDTGTVKKAFSRKRGFTKKRKKLTREGTQS